MFESRSLCWKQLKNYQGVEKPDAKQLRGRTTRKDMLGNALRDIAN